MGAVRGRSVGAVRLMGSGWLGRLVMGCGMNLVATRVLARVVLRAGARLGALGRAGQGPARGRVLVLA
jgi:hypothetical protein